MIDWWTKLRIALLGGLVIATLASFFQGHFWWLDLFAHFRWQYVLASLFVLAFSFDSRRQLYVASLVLVGNLWGVSQSGHAMTASDPANINELPPISVVFLNTNLYNMRYGEIKSFIKSTGADIVVLSEMRVNWKQSFDPLLQIYPYYHQVMGQAVEDDIPSGIVLLSRYPLENLSSVVNPVRNHAYMLAANVLHPSGTFTAVGVHLTNSITPYRAANQKAEVSALADWASKQSRLAFIVGDLNLTPFANQYQKLLTEARLSQSKQNYFPTWPSSLMPGGIPIDHVLAGSRGNIIEMAVGPDVGSDHRPVIAKISLN